jgi:putative transposase
MSETLERQLALDALNLALGQRRPGGAIHHSDHGSQGRFKRSSQHLERRNCDGYSKAPFGSIWASNVAVAGTASTGATEKLSAVLGIGCCGSFE